MSPLIMVVEDERILGDSICTYLEHHGYTTAVARSGEEGIPLAEENSPDVALVDNRLPGVDGLGVLRKLKDVSAGIEVVMMTAHASVASAVEAMKAGAFDYLTKPLDLDEVRVVVDKALAHQRMRRELSYLKAREETGGHTAEIVGESPTIRVLRQQIDRIAALESREGDAPTVLIRGETGSGKEMVARAIHYGSPRPRARLSKSTAPPSLRRSWRRSCSDTRRAPTPTLGLPNLASSRRRTAARCSWMRSGTWSSASKVKVLKAIEEKSVRRVGGLRTKAFNARIVAATNRNLEAAIAKGAFRPDLYTASRRSRWSSRHSGRADPTSRCSRVTSWIASRGSTASQSNA